MKEKKKTISISRDETLLEVLSKNVAGASKKKLKSYLKYKMVEVEGKIETNGNKALKKGDRVTVYFSKREIEDYKLDIIYEDSDLIAIDKPAGLLSISNSKEKELTAFRLVSDHIKKEQASAKLFVVHRLDQGTSGVLLFAKNLKLKEKLQKDWGEIVLKREYIAVVEGKIDDKKTIKSYLTMNHFQIVHSTKNKSIGHLAITHYESLKCKNNRSMLRVLIDTGRRNQIRVHMSESGHPIVGDKKYGAKSNPINRIALHASKLHLVDPRDGKVLKLEVPVPKEIEKLTL